MAEEKKGNPLVTGAIITGVAVTAAVLSKKENRDKAKKIVGQVIKQGKKIMATPKGKAVVTAVAAKVAQEGIAKLSDKKK